MQTFIKWSILCLLFLTVTVTPALAQNPEEIEVEEEEETTTPGSSETGIFEEPSEAPLDDVVKKEIMVERKVLAYQPVRESDIMFEKRVWRIIDVREKMNLPFSYPEDPFFQILQNAATKGELPVYSTEDDKFTKRLSTDDVLSMLSETDTVVTFDPETYEERVQIVRNEINWEDVKRFRIKEVWFFDKETSKLEVRILGIAPLIDVKDDEGNFRFEKPMFWVYYPHARELFARHRVFTLGGNTNTTLSWEDMFEMRYFASYIYKESNVYDRKVSDYLTGVDVLMESEKIKNDIFNMEHDLWQY